MDGHGDRIGNKPSLLATAEAISTEAFYLMFFDL